MEKDKPEIHDKIVKRTRVGIVKIYWRKTYLGNLVDKPFKHTVSSSDGIKKVCATAEDAERLYNDLVAFEKRQTTITMEE